MTAVSLTEPDLRSIYFCRGRRTRTNPTVHQYEWSAWTVTSLIILMENILEQSKEHTYIIANRIDSHESDWSNSKIIIMGTILSILWPGPKIL